MTVGLISDFLPGCIIDRLEQAERGLILYAHVKGTMAACPTCQQASLSIHSSYVRSPRDLPLGEQAMCLRLRIRRFRCRNPACPRQIFAERLPTWLPVYAQRTLRLTRILQTVGLTVGGEAGVRLLGQLRIPTSGRTLLRLLRCLQVPAETAVRVLGVDDWAIRKGRTYGTLLVDLERHRPIDLLPDRSATTLATWLQQHPALEIITRDRATEYTRGASEGAPQAVQVADRWHLLQNLRQMLERLMHRLYPQVKQLAVSGAEGLATGVQLSRPRTRLRLDPQDKRAIAASRTQAQALYQQVQTLHKRGCSMRQIARQLSISRTTVHKYCVAETFPERAQRLLSPSMLDAYLPYLIIRHQAGCEDAKQLWRELGEQGYPGTSRQVSRWLRQRRQAAATPGPYREAVVVAIKARAEQTSDGELPSYKQLTWLLIRAPETLAATEAHILRHICQDSRIEQTYQLAQQFCKMIRHHDVSPLDAWLHACKTSSLAELINFATGICQDYLAVRAALTTEWSNGQTEGQVNRLKFLKRQMYGRANFDLLRLRVLHPT